jgi:hypothetical protein
MRRFTDVEAAGLTQRFDTRPQRLARRIVLCFRERRDGVGKQQNDAQRRTTEVMSYHAQARLCTRGVRSPTNHVASRCR